MSGNQKITDMEGLGKALETVAAAVHQFACPLEVTLKQGFFELSFLLFQETRQEFCGDIRSIRPIRVLRELLAKTKGCTILLVISTAC